MLPGTGELVLVCASVLILLASGWWTDRRYRGFTMIPAHYDVRGRATRMAPRRTMAWTLPVLFSCLLVILTFVVAAAPDAYSDGSPLMWALINSVTLIGAQVFVLWLLARWARSQ
ncbi:MAG: hypothetical protein AAF697_06735 [Pseudomonadota bacterium]